MQSAHVLTIMYDTHDDITGRGVDLSNHDLGRKHIHITLVHLALSIMHTIHHVRSIMHAVMHTEGIPRGHT